MKKLLCFALFCVILSAFLNAEGYWLPVPPAGNGYYYWVPQHMPQVQQPPVYYYSVPQVIIPQQPSAPPPPNVYFVYPKYPGTPAGRYKLVVSQCYSSGNVAVPANRWFSRSYCTTYIDGTVIFNFVFNNGTTVEYRLQNPILRTRYSSAINKTIYSLVETIGTYPVFSPIRCEVYSTANAIREIVLFEPDNRSITISFGF